MRLAYSEAARSNTVCNDLETSIKVWLSEQMAACQVLRFDRCGTPGTCSTCDSPVIPLCRKLEINYQWTQLLYLFANTVTVQSRRMKNYTKAEGFSVLNFKCNLTWKVKQNYLGGQNDFRHLTWVSPVVSRIQMRALIWANPSPQKRKTEAVSTSIAGTESQTAKVINRWRRAWPVSLPESFFSCFFFLAALHAVPPAITPAAARLHDNWPEPPTL